MLDGIGFMNPPMNEIDIPSWAENLGGRGQLQLHLQPPHFWTGHIQQVSWNHFIHKCRCMSVCVCMYVSTPRALITNHVKDKCNNQIRQFYGLSISLYDTWPEPFNDWLMANIVPMFKEGNRNLASKYQPISLTSTCCKVMELIIFHFIMNHLVKYIIIT